MATNRPLDTPATPDNDLLKPFGKWIRLVLTPLASLKLTVTLFALSILLIFAGTLAQVELNMWEVIDQYFRSTIAWVDFNVFVPKSWFPELHDKIPGRFPMPGGFLIGVLMAINLEAAHAIRFKIQAKGSMRIFGSLVLALGALITYLVILSGHNSDGLQGHPPFAWSTLWLGIRGTLFACAAAFGAALVLPSKSSSAGKKIILASLALTFGGLGAWASSTMLTEPSLRILWQLIQGGLAGLILLAGCFMLFKRRAGVVLLHLGITLMMFSEFFAGQYHVEGRISINEGETVDFSRDIRMVELAIVDTADSKVDKVIAIPGSKLLPQRRFGTKSKDKVLVADPQLPFDIHIEQFMKNSDIVPVKPDTKTYANQGSGKQFQAKELTAGSGTDGGEVDFAAAYVELREKGTSNSLGKFLLSQIISSQGFAEKVEVDGKKYNLSLRFKRSYKPYSVTLKDVRKDDYLGTNMPMNYSSDVVMTKLATDGEPAKQIGEFHIWMNNPLRYAGETFYQSGYNFDPRTKTEATTLQVVANTGWMMPYIGCMLVGVGMAAHFCIGLWRFLERKLNEELTASEPAKTGWVEAAIPFVIVLLLGGYAASKFRPPTDTKANMKIHEFGKLPVVFQGRAKPMDTLARNTLRVVSNRETFVPGRPDPDVKRPSKEPAIRWMLDVISGSPEAKTHRVFRIDNLEVIATLGLQRRKGLRYAEEEFEGKIEMLNDELVKFSKLDPANLDIKQKKMMELGRRIRAVRLLEAAFTPIPIPEMPSEEELSAEDNKDALNRLRTISTFFQRSEEIQGSLKAMEPPLAVPSSDESEWDAFANAWMDAYVQQIRRQEVASNTKSWAKMLSAYGSTDVNAFNDAVAEYQQTLGNEPPSLRNAKGVAEDLDLKKIRFEHFFNSSQPFTSSIVLYIVAFILSGMGWQAASFGKSSVFNRSAFWLILLTFLLHTFALWSRVYISGRPPITNLYSSAVFIGWGAVLLGLLLEVFYKLGIGNALSSVAGFSTLLIAYALAADGDTFTVLRAVLDTQFWLATHVVCITLGYATTFVAGLLGVVYVVGGASRRPQMGKALTSMTYGTLCFAIFFSFIGTVLGGLWADDSWGRFWGWDPKENGALMIVLWNALVLHARWGGMARQRGIALLAIFGNVITAWSWFGVNELGVGLHSYGFTEGVLKYLGYFVASQMLIIGVGLVTMRDGNANTKLAA